MPLHYNFIFFFFFYIASPRVIPKQYANNIGRFTMHTTHTIDKYKYNKQRTNTSCFDYLLTSYASGKSAKVCKHVFVLICSIREFERQKLSLSYFCRAHELFPMTFTNRRILQFADSPQRRYHILHRSF